METLRVRGLRPTFASEELEGRCVLSLVEPTGWPAPPLASPGQVTPPPQPPPGPTAPPRDLLATPTAPGRPRPDGPPPGPGPAGAPAPPGQPGFAPAPGNPPAPPAGAMPAPVPRPVAWPAPVPTPVVAPAAPAATTVPVPVAVPTSIPAPAPTSAASRSAGAACGVTPGDPVAATPAAPSPPAPSPAASSLPARSGEAATARAEVAPVDRTAPVASPSAASSVPVASVSARDGAWFAPVGPAGGPPPPPPPPPPVTIGRDTPSAVAQPGTAEAGVGPRVAAPTRTPVGEVPIAVDRGRDEGRSEPVVAATPRPDAGDPRPELAGVITSLVPAGRATIEAALGQLLEPFDGLGPALGGLTPSRLLAASLTVGVSVLAAEAALRFRRRGEAEDEVAGGAAARFPGLPVRPEGAWS